jgi:hypothetical protein
MRSLVGKWFNANEQHILDWYHIARRFEGIGKGLVYLPLVSVAAGRRLTESAYLEKSEVLDKFKTSRVLIYSHVTPYGTFRLDMNERLVIETAVAA